MNDSTDSAMTADSTATEGGERHAPLGWRLWGWIVLFCLAGAGLYFFLIGSSNSQPFGQTRAGAANRATPVAVATVQTGDVKVYLSGLGTVTPFNSVTVRSRVDGQLDKVLFREGQFVEVDELLAEIDPRPFQVQLAQAEGQMARDQALLKNAQIDLKRYRGLFQEDSIAKQQLDTQEALVRQYEGTVKADQGQIDEARLQLAYSRIVAPISGRVGLRQVDPGNIVHTSDQEGLVVINQIQPITVIFAIPQDDLPAVMQRLRAGAVLPVEAWSRDGGTRLADGTLLTVDNQIDTTTGTVKLKAQFANDDHGLFPNQFVNVRLLTDILRGVTFIPTAAVQRGTRGAFAYLVKEDDTVTLRQLRVGPVEGESIVVEQGLAANETVVVDGLDKLREGAKVEVIQRDTDAAAGAVPRKDGA